MFAPAKLPGLPRGLLPPKFFEVAADRSTSPFATPFEKYRRQERLGVEEMAERMHMPIEDYVAFENGKVRPVPIDILAYCEALDLHPLDLYAEPYPGTPLSPELRDALWLADRSPCYEDSFRQRAQQRLVLEYRRGTAMLESSREELVPLRIAMELSSGPQGEAFYHCDDDFTAQEDRTPRVMFNNCLNAYQLMLEDEVALHTQIYMTLGNAYRRNVERMEKAAKVLYGVERENVIERMRQHIAQTQSVRLLKEMLRQNPYFFGALDPVVMKGKSFAEMTGEDQNHLQERLQHLLSVVCVDTRCQEALKNQSGSMDHSIAALRDFEVWRESPRTQYLLDWFENHLILDDGYSRCGSPAQGLIAAP